MAKSLTERLEACHSGAKHDTLREMGQCDVILMKTEKLVRKVILEGKVPEEPYLKYGNF